jgi:hypothetical protein
MGPKIREVVTDVRHYLEKLYGDRLVHIVFFA